MAETRITAEFFGSPVTILDHAGQRWLTAEQVGICLGYGEANARHGISHLYSRHADEFTEADTCVVKLTTQGQGRDIRIFSASGCHLLGFFASTPRAKAFRAWAKQTLTADGAPLAAPAPCPVLPGLKMTRHKERAWRWRCSSPATISPTSARRWASRAARRAWCSTASTSSRSAPGRRSAATH